MAEDDVDIGIGVRETPGSQQVLDAIKAKLAAYRQELQALVEQEQQFGAGSGAGLEAGLRAIDSEIDDVTKKFVLMGRQIDVTNTTAVNAYRQEAVALRDYLETIDAASTAINRIGNTLSELRDRQNAAGSLSPTPEATAGVGPAQAQNVANVDTEIQRLTTDINASIGSFVRMGQAVDVSSREAVQAYRLQGDALAANLAAMGATDAELNRLGTSIAGVERAYGANTAAVELNIQEQERIPVTARRGANAVATLAFGLEAGGTSARSMAIAVGSMTSAMAAFAESERVAAAATGIGALITVLAVVIGLFYELNKEAKETSNVFENLGSLRASQLRILEEASRRDTDAAQKAAAAMADIVDEEQNSSNILLRARAAYDVIEARRLNKQYDDLVKQREKITNALVAAESEEQRQLTEQRIQAQHKSTELQVEELNGRAAAEHLANEHEREDSLRQLAKKTGDEDTLRGIRTAIQEQYAAREHQIERERTEKFLDLQRQFHDQRVTAEEKLAEDVFGVQRAAADRQFGIDQERIRKDRDLKPEEQTKLISDARAARDARAVAIERDRSDAIIKIREEAQGRLDELSGQGVNEEKIRQGHKKEMDILEAAIKSDATSPVQKAAAQRGKELVEALIPQEIAVARLAEIDKETSKVLSQQEEQIKRTDILTQAHALTNEQARERISAALRQEIAEVERTLPLLEQEAALLPGDEAAQAKVEAYRTKLLQLQVTLREISDEFFKLKEAAISSTEDAIAKLVTSIPDMIQNNSKQVDDINIIRVHLASAQAELADLLKGPQTEASAQRITQLRAEIQGVNIELNNAKNELTTWKNLFLDAARSIVKALFDVEARMFAVYLVQQSLRLFGSFGGGGAGTAASMSGDVLGGVFAAEGGLILGPGTSTSDSIPGRLSNGEYVINAAAVSRAGVGFLDAINSLGHMGTIKPRRFAGFAAGGLVTPANSEAAGQHNITLGLEDGLVLRHLESSEGETVLLKFAERNRNKLRQLLG